MDLAVEYIDQIAKLMSKGGICFTKSMIDFHVTTEQMNTEYNNPNAFGSSVYEHIKALELDEEEFTTLKRFVEMHGFDFISEYTDISSLKFLIKLGCIIKVTQDRLKNEEELKLIADSGLDCILCLNEVDDLIFPASILKENKISVLFNKNKKLAELSRLDLNIPNLHKKGHFNDIDIIFNTYLSTLTDFDMISFKYTLNKYMKGKDHITSWIAEDVIKLIKMIRDTNNILGGIE